MNDDVVIFMYYLFIDLLLLVTNLQAHFLSRYNIIYSNNCYWCILYNAVITWGGGVVGCLDSFLVGRRGLLLTCCRRDMHAGGGRSPSGSGDGGLHVLLDLELAVLHLEGVLRVYRQGHLRDVALLPFSLRFLVAQLAHELPHVLLVLVPRHRERPC
jgi:hypothetical protein